MDLPKTHWGSQKSLVANGIAIKSSVCPSLAVWPRASAFCFLSSSLLTCGMEVIVTAIRILGHRVWEGTQHGGVHVTLSFLIKHTWEPLLLLLITWGFFVSFSPVAGWRAPKPYIRVLVSTWRCGRTTQGLQAFQGPMKTCESQESLLALKYEKKTAELELINVLLCVYKM